MHNLITSSHFLAVAFTALTFTAAAQSYTIRTIPPLLGHDFSTASALNRKGVVVGVSNNSAATQQRGIVSSPPHSSSVSIGFYGTRTSSTATSINNFNIVTGFSEGGAGNGKVPVVWADNFLTTTHIPAGALASNNNDINNLGALITETDISSFILNDGTITDLPPQDNFDFPLALAINDSEVAVGSALSLSLSKIRAVRWTNGSPVELQVLSAGRSIAYDIAGNGAIVGVSATESAQDRAFMLTPENVPLNLGILSGDTTSEAHGTNGTDAVGFSYSIANGYRAVLFQGGVAKNLNDLIPAGSGWMLQKSFGITDYGQICGEGTFNGEARGFLLTPNPPIGGAADFDFLVSDNGWTAATNIPPFEPAEAAHVPTVGYGIRATAFPAFGFLQSPPIPLAQNRRYRIWCTIATLADTADAAPQLRLRAIEASTNVSELLALDSTSGILPGEGLSKTFAFSLNTVSGNLNQTYRLNLDLTFFDPFDDQDAWVYLQRVYLAEE